MKIVHVEEGGPGNEAKDLQLEKQIMLLSNHNNV